VRGPVNFRTQAFSKISRFDARTDAIVGSPIHCVSERGSNGPADVIHYALAGLCVGSEFALPGAVELPSGAPSRERVVIRRASVPETLMAATYRAPDAEWDGNELLIRIDQAARYRVTMGGIDVEALEGSDPRDVHAYILGTVFGALCHLRGIFPLHAAAIQVGDMGIAFAGDSGAGKSTMAAAFAARGHQVLCDDVSYIRRSNSGSEIFPGVNRLRLWESAMTGLGISQRDADREFRGFNKFLLPAPAPDHPDKARGLHAVYELAEARDSEVSVERLQGSDAFEAILGNVYRSQLARQIGRAKEIFVASAELARRVPVFRLSRPLDFNRLGEVIDRLSDHFRKLPAEATV